MVEYEVVISLYSDDLAASNGIVLLTLMHALTREGEVARPVPAAGGDPL